MGLTGEYVPSRFATAAKQVEEYESSGGERGNTLRGMPVVIVTMRGAKSGKIRKVPVMRVEHDGSYAMIASMGGAPTHPHWYHNLVAHPDVELQDGPVAKPYRAHLATGAERAAWWQRAVEAFPDYDQYQRRTSREIPVFVLDPA
ncbi:MAG TPA: nitroreductase family deazaflavin-dependent oxidoreductase [Micromonosporaceae bacterium]